jgi:hypothetical protein
LALPLGELSPKVTERALPLRSLSVLASLGQLSQGERQGVLALTDTLIQKTGTADYPTVPVDCLMRPAHCGRTFHNIGITFPA